MPTKSKVNKAKRIQREIALEFEKSNPSNERVKELREELKVVFKK